MLHIEGISYRYRDAASPALDQVTLNIPAGGVYGLLGPNGAGKTTLISLLAGLLTSANGKISLNGQALAEGEWQQRAQALTGIDLADFFQAALYTTAPLPLAESLQHLGVDLQWQALPRNHGGDVVDTYPPEPAAGADFGARFSPQPYGIKLTHVLNGGSAEAAGLCAGDEIMALNQLACRDFAAAWARLAVGEHISVHYFRHGLLQFLRRKDQSGFPRDVAQHLSVVFLYRVLQFRFRHQFC